MSARLPAAAGGMKRRPRLRAGAGLRSALGGLLIGTALLLPACSPSPEEGREPGRAEATHAEWEWLQSTYRQLQEERERLARLEAAPAEGTEATPETSETSETSAEIAQRRRQLEERAADFNRRLVEYLNARAREAAGSAPDERLRTALRMKSDEDIRLARRYIEQSGDYRRAIEIYETALAADPENPRLREELAAARERRYVTRERFGRVEPGMGPAEVRALLGQPNLQDVRQYPEHNVTAWFYPKDASGAAAAVWFEGAGEGARVYLADFDALQPPDRPAGPPARP